MLPTLDEALNELKTAEKRNPGPWVKHSMNVGVAARNIAEKIPGMDPKKAYIVGLLHDFPRHVKLFGQHTAHSRGISFPCADNCRRFFLGFFIKELFKVV